MGLLSQLRPSGVTEFPSDLYSLVKVAFAFSLLPLRKACWGCAAFLSSVNT